MPPATARLVAPIVLAGLLTAAARDLRGDPLPPGASLRLGTVRFRHPPIVTAVAFAPDGKTVASAGHDNAIRLWDAARGRPTQAWRTPRRHGVQSVVFRDDGTV